MAPRSPPRAGTGYIGLESWLANNQQQAAGMADNLVSGINASGKKAEGILNDSVELFNYGVDRNALSYNPEAYGGPGGVDRAEADAADAAKRVGGVWTGPSKLDEMANYTEGRTAAGETQRKSGLAADFYGRQALLQDEYGKNGGYSAGAQRLDSALAGAAGGEKLDAAKAQWGNLLKRYDTADASARTYATDMQARNKQTAEQMAGAAKDMRARYTADRERESLAQRDVYNKEQERENVARQQQGRANRDAVDSGRIPAGRKGVDGLESWQATGAERPVVAPDRRYVVRPKYPTSQKGW